MPYVVYVYTVIETPVYSKKAEQILTEEERDASDRSSIPPGELRLIKEVIDHDR